MIGGPPKNARRRLEHLFYILTAKTASSGRPDQNLCKLCRGSRCNAAHIVQTVAGTQSQASCRARALPGVREVALSDWLPLSDDRNNGALGTRTITGLVMLFRRFTIGATSRRRECPRTRARGGPALASLSDWPVRSRPHECCVGSCTSPTDTHLRGDARAVARSCARIVVAPGASRRECRPVVGVEKRSRWRGAGWKGGAMFGSLPHDSPQFTCTFHSAHKRHFSGSSAGEGSSVDESVPERRHALA